MSPERPKERKPPSILIADDNKGVGGRVTIHHSFNEIIATDWNALIPSDSPVLRHEFLSAFETSGCVIQDTGWEPHHLGLYNAGKLVKFNSKTNQNGKEKYVNMKLHNGEYEINGSSYQGKAPTDYLLGTWWNHSIVEAEAQISAVSGRIIKQKVTFLGKEIVKINDKSYKTLHFNFSSTDKKLSKDKRLNTDVWYDEKTLNWIKASFEKKGKWEYRLISID